MPAVATRALAFLTTKAAPVHADSEDAAEADHACKEILAKEPHEA
jgi:hypothetical protein